MISAQSKFRFVSRGFKKTIVLIPGWATDYRIFERLDLDYNYLLPVEFSLFDFQDRLSDFLNKESIDRVSLFGWSQGAFLAAEFASRHPERIEELILLNLRRAYDPAALKDISAKLKKSKRAYLYRFYRDCFSKNDKSGLDWFNKNLLKPYLDSFGLEELLCGLNYLVGARIHPEFLSGVNKIRIFHGAKDKIAPIAEAMDIKSDLVRAEFISFPDVGHITFLHPNFSRAFNG